MAQGCQEDSRGQQKHKKTLKENENNETREFTGSAQVVVNEKQCVSVNSLEENGDSSNLKESLQVNGSEEEEHEGITTNIQNATEKSHQENGQGGEDSNSTTLLGLDGPPAEVNITQEHVTPSLSHEEKEKVQGTSPNNAVDDDSVPHPPPVVTTTSSSSSNGGDLESSEEPISEIMDHLILGDKEPQNISAGGQGNNESKSIHDDDDDGEGDDASKDNNDSSSDILAECNGDGDGEKGNKNKEQEEEDNDDSGLKILPDLPGEEDEEEEASMVDNNGVMEIDDDDQEQENQTAKSSKPKSNSKHGGEGGSDEDVAMIRIRDIGSLGGDDDSDEETTMAGQKPAPPPPPLENLIVPNNREHTSYVMMNKNDQFSPTSVFVSIQMRCEEEMYSKTTSNRERRRKTFLLRKQLMELSGMLKDLQKKGQAGINVRQPPDLTPPSTSTTTTTSQAPAAAAAASLVVGASPPPTSQTPVIRVSSPTNNARLSSPPINCVVTSRGIQQVVPTSPSSATYSRPTRPHILTSGPHGNPQIRSSNITGNMHQIVFDPNTRLLLCPTTQASTATTASQQLANANNMRQTQNYRAIQAPPQFLAAMRSGSIQMVNGGTTTSLTRMIQPNSNNLVDPSSSIVGLHNASNINMPRITAPVSQMMTASSQYLRQQTPPLPPRPQAIPTVTVMTPASSSSNLGLKTYQSIAPKSSTMTFVPNIVQQHAPASFGAAASTVLAQRTQQSSINNSARNRPITPPQLAGATTNKPRPIYQPPAIAAPVSASFNRNNNNNVNNSTDPAKQQQIEITAGSQPPTIPLNNPKDKAGQNAKTFPSLVVVVKPYLQEKLTKAQAAAVRSELDSKVKTILMQSPVKFTEWLIQKGLLKMEHKCYVHNTAYKLGMYSDSEKYPYSGGYVFTVDCCPDKQLPVFQGSIFEASVYPPGTTMKLIYHWACQTPAPSVLQWVKVTSYYLKNFYTLLRSVCVAALHEHASTMGGRGKYIEVGVVTLGTTQAGAKQTKIEILGVFDPGAKFIRMKLLNTSPNLTVDGTKRERSDQILTLLSNWINRDSVLLIDSSLDKSMVEKLGFRNVSQSKGAVGGAAKTTIPTNVNVMNYLKNIVPKMFQNTLCVLSKSLIQQFLDELSWRELWGSHPLRAFDTAISHLVGMTKADIGELLIPRLNKISLNPFAEWSYSQKTLPPPSGIECLPDSIRSQPLSELVRSAVGMDSAISSLVSTYMNTASSNSQTKSIITSSVATTASLTTSSLGNIGIPSPQGRKISNSNNNNNNSNSTLSRTVATKRKAEEDIEGLNLQKLLTEGSRSHTLQAYYYVYCPPTAEKYNIEFPTNLKCPLCNKALKGNNEALSHLISHVLSAGRLTQNPHGCRYCLKEVASAALLEQHVNYAHKKLNEENVCRICADKYPSETLLIIHMWKRHVNCEAPYRCEVCEYRTSFHYDAVDHFYKEHGSTDTVQCPVCLKTIPVRSIACLKNVVTHLQNHILKKGKKCRDCCLSFSSDADYRSHLLGDSAHESRTSKNFVQHEVEDEPIRMPKPPTVNKDLNIPPAPKKGKSQRTSGSTNLQTLNSSFAVPLNPSDKYMFTPMKVKISDVDMFVGMNCWECFKSITLPGHYRGTMKCSRCRFETCCSYTIHKHIKSHDVNKLNQTVVRTKLALSREADLTSDALECSGCYFVSGSTRRFAYHLLDTGHKVCSPKNVVAETAAAITTEIAAPDTIPASSSDATA